MAPDWEALIELADKTLPAYGEVLDELVSGLMTTLNDVQQKLYCKWRLRTGFLPHLRFL